MFTVAMVKRHTDKRPSATLSPVKLEWLSMMVYLHSEQCNTTLSTKTLHI